MERNMFVDRGRVRAEHLVLAETSGIVISVGLTRPIGAAIKFSNIAEVLRDNGITKSPTSIRKGRELKPRPAATRPVQRADYAGAARDFQARRSNAESHDQPLRAMRQRRDTGADTPPEWDELRKHCSGIKTLALRYLENYREQCAVNAEVNGVHIYWATDADEHNRMVHEISARNCVRQGIKSKSLLVKKCSFPPSMEGTGYNMIEIDLGERFQQLEIGYPSHFVVPAVHKMRGDFSRLFSEKFGSDVDNNDAHHLTKTLRQVTRPQILKADASMTGANFPVAETGGFVFCTNEGTADLPAKLANLHDVSIGIQKITPIQSELSIPIRLWSRPAFDGPISWYTMHFCASKSGGKMHIVLMDNGRSERLGLAKFWSTLKWIRWGACLKTCLVFRRSRGLSYDATYTGPLQLILDPNLNARRYTNLPFASTLNGSCTTVCSVKNNIYGQNLAWRRVLVANRQAPWAKKPRWPYPSGYFRSRRPIGPPSNPLIPRLNTCRSGQSTTKGMHGPEAASRRNRQTTGPSTTGIPKIACSELMRADP